MSLTVIWLLCMGVPLLMGLWAQSKVKRTFAKWSEVPVHNGMTGAQAAAEVVRASGLPDVEIRAVEGRLSDHYDPRNRTLNLSPDVGQASTVAALGVALGNDEVDGRRFRMTIVVDGVEPWEEHGWSGREVRVGDAVLRVAEPTPRCVVTTRDPDSGRRDAPVLKALADLRGKDDVTFGVWCDVVAPGRVRVGDPTVVAPSGR